MLKSSGPALLRLFRSRVGRHRKAQLLLVIKALSFQVFSVLITFLTTFVLTHDVNMSLSISVIDIVFKAVLYYVFDVSWSRWFSHF